MTDTNNSSNASSNTHRKLSLTEKIAEMFSMGGHQHHHQQSPTSQHKHQLDPPETRHDSAFEVEGCIVGAHAVPPIGLERQYQSTSNYAHDKPQRAHEHLNQKGIDQQRISGSQPVDSSQQKHRAEAQVDSTEGLDESPGGNGPRPLM
ncbi:hypothetical protein FBU30_005691 [Linnemannia zychae]|nr:hypothetical protein FBU30_005691 [Linnemannia zychae]